MVWRHRYQYIHVILSLCKCNALLPLLAGCHNYTNVCSNTLRTKPGSQSAWLFHPPPKEEIDLPFCFQGTALSVNHSDIKKSLRSCVVVVIHFNHFPSLSSLLPLFIISSALSLPSSLCLCVDSESFAEEMQVYGAPISQKEEPKCFTTHCNKM